MSRIAAAGVVALLCTTVGAAGQTGLNPASRPCPPQAPLNVGNRDRAPFDGLRAERCPDDFVPPAVWATGDAGTELLKINVRTGKPVVVGATGYAGTAPLAFHPDGTIYSFTQTMTTNVNVPEQLAVLDRGTGRATLVGSPLPERARMMGLIAAPDGNLYAAGLIGSYANKLLVIDRRTGQPREVGPFKNAVSLMDFTCDAEGNLYGANQTALYRINEQTGEATKLVTFSGDLIVSGSARVMGIHFADDGTLYATDFVASGLGNSSLYTVNALTGEGTRIANTGIAQIHSADMLPPTPKQRLAALMLKVQGYTTNSALGRSVTAKLDVALQMLDVGTAIAACHALYEFRNEVGATGGKTLSGRQTAQLLTDSTWAETSLNCPR